MPLFSAKTLFLASSVLAIVALEGCAIGDFKLSGVEPAATVARISGSVHGGQQPVSSASIGLFTVGAGGYGSAATSILNAGVTVSTGTDGSFNLNSMYTCPSSTALTYITATGGNPGLATGTSNSAIQLVALLGQCGVLTNTFVVINEVTTAAAAYSLSQYFSAANADSFGSPNTTQALVGITNAFSVSNNLVNIATGTATVSGTAGTLGSASITYTPDANKLNTIADMLAACVNTAGPGDSTGNCNTLLGDTPPTGSTAADTLQAAVFLNLNPTSTNANSSASNMTALFGLVSGTPPFTAVSGQPTDWTIGINYSAGTSATQTLINGANDIAIDSGGNAWLINYNTAAATTESLTELSPTGAPLVNPFNSGAAAPASMNGSSPRNLAIDTNNNIYVTATSGSGYVFKYATATAAQSSLTASNQPYGVAIDGNNNIFVSHNSGSNNGLDEFTGGVLASTNRIEYPFNNLAQYMTLDSSGNPYLSNASTTTQVVEVTGLNGVATCTTYPCTPTNDTSLSATYTSITGTFTTPFGLAAAKSGGIWTANNTTGNDSVTYNSSPTAATSYGTAANLYFNAPRKVAVDGNNIAWVLNRGTGTVSEIKTDGTILSPIPVSPAVTPVGFVHAGIMTVTGIAIDPSGNVWVANATTSASTTDQNSVFEIIGCAAPTTTPLSLAIKSGNVGVKP